MERSLRHKVKWKKGSFRTVFIYVKPIKSYKTKLQNNFVSHGNVCMYVHVNAEKKFGK